MALSPKTYDIKVSADNKQHSKNPLGDFDAAPPPTPTPTPTPDLLIADNFTNGISPEWSGNEGATGWTAQDGGIYADYAGETGGQAANLVLDVTDLNLDQFYVKFRVKRERLAGAGWCIPKILKVHGQTGFYTDGSTNWNDHANVTFNGGNSYGDPGSINGPCGFGSGIGLDNDSECSFSFFAGHYSNTLRDGLVNVIAARTGGFGADDWGSNVWHEIEWFWKFNTIAPVELADGVCKMVIDGEVVGYFTGFYNKNVGNKPIHKFVFGDNKNAAGPAGNVTRYWLDDIEIRSAPPEGFLDAPAQ